MTRAAGYDPTEVCGYGDCTRRPDFLVESYTFDFRGCVGTIEPDAECPAICRAHRDEYSAQHDAVTISFAQEPHLRVRGVRYLALDEGLNTQHIFRRITW